jgi:serine/threonine-protein kinase RsbW
MSSNGGVNVTTVSIAAGPLAAPVLGRVVAMLAARANLPIDRLNDAVLLSDTIAATVGPSLSDGRMRVEIGTSGARLALRVGPLVEDGAGRMRRASQIPGAGDVLERLADEVSVERDDDGEYLVLAVA